jgi:anion-transporting  ArsA/GET3 family ATPase
VSRTGLASAIDGARVVICCGSGGVGKTTTAAAIGMRAAVDGARVVVVTIDPAKRLADAFGLDAGLTNEPARLDIPDADGELWASMLDTTATFDDLVRAEAATPAQAEEILANRFYRNVAGGLSGTEEYMAAEKLYQLHADERFDLIVVDTPPSRHALDFLEAPARLARFIDHRLFRWLMLPARSGLKVLNLAAQPVLRTIGKVVGGDVLADAIAFFQAFEGMQGGFRRRAEAVAALFTDPSTRFVVVTTPRHDSVAEATFFTSRLAERQATPAALVVNRTQPRFGKLTAAEATERADRASGDDPALAASWANLAELTAVADGEDDAVAALAGRAPVVVHVPQLGDDVHDLEAIGAIGDALFGARRQARPG